VVRGAGAGHRPRPGERRAAAGRPHRGHDLHGAEADRLHLAVLHSDGGRPRANRHTSRRWARHTGSRCWCWCWCWSWCCCCCWCRW
jgi:hypothetical protein